MLRNKLQYSLVYHSHIKANLERSFTRCHSDKYSPRPLQTCKREAEIIIVITFMLFASNLIESCMIFRQTIALEGQKDQ